MLRVLGIWKNCTSRNECVYHQLEQGLLKLWMVQCSAVMLKKPEKCVKLKILIIPIKKYIDMSKWNGMKKKHVDVLIIWRPSGTFKSFYSYRTKTIKNNLKRHTFLNNFSKLCKDWNIPNSFPCLWWSVLPINPMWNVFDGTWHKAKTKVWDGLCQSH